MRISELYHERTEGNSRYDKEQVEMSKRAFYEHQNPKSLISLVRTIGDRRGLELFERIRKKEGLSYALQSKYLPISLSRIGYGTEMVLFDLADFKRTEIPITKDVELESLVEDLTGRLDYKRTEHAPEITTPSQGYKKPALVLTKGYRLWKGTHDIGEGQVKATIKASQFYSGECKAKGITGFYIMQQDGRLGWIWLRVRDVAEAQEALAA